MAGFEPTTTTPPVYHRKGLERLLRYCARPVFASERLKKLSDDMLIYKPTKQWKSHTGSIRQSIVLSPLEFIYKLALLIPPPRKHRHRYFGVLAPNSPYREAVTVHSRQELGAGNVAMQKEKQTGNAMALVGEIEPFSSTRLLNPPMTQIGLKRT